MPHKIPKKITTIMYEPCEEAARPLGTYLGGSKGKGLRYATRQLNEEYEDVFEGVTVRLIRDRDSKFEELYIVEEDYGEGFEDSGNRLYFEVSTLLEL